MHKIVHILDIRGLIINSWNSRKDPDAATGEDGRPLLTVEHGLDALHEKFLHDIFHTYDAAPRDIVVVWDGGNKYRTSLYPGYKGNRVRTAKKEISERRVRKDELLVRVKRLLGSIGVTQVTLADEEADDVAGYLAWKISHQCPVIIHTIDHDLVACRSWGAKHPIMVAVNGDIERQFTNKGGSGDAVPPHLITLYKSLVGDKTDEYLGIAGFGPKAWDEFMAEFGADGMVQLDGVIRTLNPRILDLATQSSPNKWLSHLRGHMDEWALQYRLAGIHPWLCEGVRENKPIHLKWHKEVPSYTALAEATKGLPEPARKALRARYEKWLPVPFVMDSTNAVAVWEHMKDEITGLPFFPFDYETYDVLQHEPFKEAAGGRGEYVDVISSRPTGMSFCYGNNWQYAPYMTVEHKDSHNLPQSWIPGILNAVIEAGVPTLAHNQQFEYSVTWNNFGIRLPQPWDSRLMSHAIDENNSNGLKDVSSRFLGFYQMGYKETLEAAGANNMAECTSQDVLSYGVDDSLATAHFADLAWFIQVCEGTWEFTRDEDFNFVHEQSRAFLTGINFDQDRMAALETRDLASEVESEKNLRQLLADNPNIEPREAILRLFNDLWEYEQAKLSDSDPNMDPQDLQQRRLNLWDKLVGLSTYAPLTRTVETKEFVPSKVQLSKISERLGFEPFEKDSKKYISEWLLLQDERLAQADQAEAPEYEDMNTFHRRLAAALKDIKKREGAEYEEFATWCKTFLGIEDKVTTEGTELNVGSPQQMQGFLYGMLDLPIRMRSKVQSGSGRDKLGMHGSPGTDKDAVAAALAEDVQDDGDWRRPALGCYSELKRVRTAKGLFYKPYKLWPHPQTGRIHGQITNDGTVTGRPSGSRPNLLQLTKTDGGDFRGCVRPLRDDHVIISADFNGQELRILAAESNDPTMIDAYTGENRKDIHSLTASAIFVDVINTRYHELVEGVGSLIAADGSMEFSYDDYTALLHSDDKAMAKAAKAVRKMAKGTNFLIAYGGGYTTLARRLLVPGEQSKVYMERTFARYSRLQPWQQEVIEETKRLGYSETAYGTRRHIGSGILSPDDSVAKRNERQAINFKVQGAAAAHLKRVMANAHRTGLFENHQAVMIAPVYDEIAASVPRSAAYDYSMQVKELMEEQIPGHVVPQVVEFEVSADSWGYQVEVGECPTKDELEAAFEKSLETGAEKTEHQKDKELEASIVEDLALEFGDDSADYHA